MSRLSKLVHHPFVRSAWIFPIVLFALVIILSSFRVSGSSVGIYHQKFFGPEASDPSLLYGDPRGIRADEWLVWTQITLSQAENGFPRFNEDLGSGRDLSLHFEIPTKDWTTIFKPWNWSFFILPLEYAFAFKWWFLMFLLLVGSYLFFLKIFPKKIPWAVLFSIGVGLSPFVLWWYQTAVLALLGYGFLLILLGIRILDSKKIPKINSPALSNILYTLLFTYMLVGLGLVIYPPFQISIVLVVSAFLIGYLMKKKLEEGTSWKTLIQRTLIFVSSIFIASTLALVFVSDRSEVIENISNSIYPGERVTHSGNQPALDVFDSFLMPLLQSKQASKTYYQNQSEASNFILLFPYLLLPALAIVIYEYKKRHCIDWVFVTINALGVLILVRMFVPVEFLIYKVLLIDKVPNGRLLLGLGFVSFIQSLLLFSKLHALKINSRKILLPVIIYGAIIFSLLILLAFDVQKSYPGFINKMNYVYISAAIFSLIPVLLLMKKWLWLAMFLLISIVSSYRIMPLYIGLSEIKSGKLISEMKSVGTPNDTWVSTGDLYYENAGLWVNGKSLSGVQLYPDPSFWENAYGKEYEEVYNRKAHAIYTFDSSINESMVLRAKNYYQIKFSCSAFNISNINYVLSDRELSTDCTQPLRTISYPKEKLYIYRVVGK